MLFVSVFSVLVSMPAWTRHTLARDELCFSDDGQSAEAAENGTTELLHGTRMIPAWP